MHQTSLPTSNEGDKEDETFAHSNQCCYKEVLHRKENIFKLPSGKAGNAFVLEITCMFQPYANASALESMAFQAVMVMHSEAGPDPQGIQKVRTSTVNVFVILGGAD